MNSSTASNEIPYCWCNADPTQVRIKKKSLPPSLQSEILRRYEWPDSRERHRNRAPTLPYRIVEIVHKECNVLIRQRGIYWWFSEQIKLEDKIVSGKLRPAIGEFYCFLEEEHYPGYIARDQPLPGTDTSKPVKPVIFRHGNVLAYDPSEGYYWIVQSVAFPKGHPDGNLPPYKMIDVMNRSLLS